MSDFKFLEKGRSYFPFLLSISIILAACKNEAADPQLVVIIDFSISSDGFLLIQPHTPSCFDQQHFDTNKHIHIVTFHVGYARTKQHV